MKYIFDKNSKSETIILHLHEKKTMFITLGDENIDKMQRLLTVIADDLGFEDAAHFSKFFKNYTSINPSELRKTSQQSN